MAKYDEATNVPIYILVGGKESQKPPEQEQRELNPKIYLEVQYNSERFNERWCIGVLQRSSYHVAFDDGVVGVGVDAAEFYPEFRHKF